MIVELSCGVSFDSMDEGVAMAVSMAIHQGILSATRDEQYIAKCVVHGLCYGLRATDLERFYIKCIAENQTKIRLDKLARV